MIQCAARFVPPSTRVQVKGVSCKEKFLQFPLIVVSIRNPQNITVFLLYFSRNFNNFEVWFYENTDIIRVLCVLCCVWSTVINHNFFTTRLFRHLFLPPKFNASQEMILSKPVLTAELLTYCPEVIDVHVITSKIKFPHNRVSHPSTTRLSSSAALKHSRS